MTPVFVDSSVLLDVLRRQQPWLDWSDRALRAAGNVSRLVINPVVLAEVSVSYDTIDELNEALPHEAAAREPIPDEAAFVAGKVFLEYRRRGGPRDSLLPDFLIGAHAMVRGYVVLTRDARRFRSYFPTVSLIAPD